MKIIQINHFSYKAAGHIMLNLHNGIIANGDESYVVWGRGRKSKNDHEYYMNDEFGVKAHALLTRLTDRTGCYSKRSTRKLIEWIDRITPDIVHLHCVHGYYINLFLLFDYLKRKKIKVIWTQHDCWSFTGHCAYFDSVNCEKWKSHCHDCPQINTYPKSFVDASEKNWDMKKSLFDGLDMRIITPCMWLKDLVEQSFLSNYLVSTIYNGIDTKVFSYRNSDFRDKYLIGEKKIILGVASEWTERKGLKDFISLDGRIDHNKMVIVLVGLNKNQLSNVPKTIIGIERTSSAEELAEIYSTADVFFNPTYEDNFPTTNLEALSCGTKVVTYNTGGSPEAIGTNGLILPKGDYMKIIDYCDSIDHNGEKRSFLDIKQFSKEAMIENYISMYSNMMCK